MLYIRMILYAVFAALAGMQIGSFDAAGGTFTVSADQLAGIIAPLVGYVVTFLASRYAKIRGGAT